MTCGSTIGALTYLIGVNWNRIWTLLYWIAFCMPKVSRFETVTMSTRVDEYCWELLENKMQEKNNDKKTPQSETSHDTASNLATVILTTRAQ